MNCYTFEQIFHDLDRPGTAGAALREAALAHAESCTSCALLLIEAEALDFGLRRLASQDASSRAPRRVEAALLREFREQRATFSGMPGVRGIKWYAGVIGVAAMALLALGIARFHIGLLPAQPSNPVTVAANQASTVSDAGSAVAGTTADSVAGADSEEATEFYPLPYADDSASLEGGAVIRVAMPRSTLISWGFPVSGAAGTDRIPADLVVSADGTPQAIRLVSSMSD